MIDLSKIEWSIERRDMESGVPVWVSVAKVNERWKRNKGLCFGPRTVKRQIRYWRFNEWIKTNSVVHMPIIHLMNDGSITFTDGRHRFSWFRDHGLKEMPVITDRGYGAALRRAVGWISAKP